MTEYVDLADAVITPDVAGEEAVLASNDYYEPERPLPMPGIYFSPTRSLKVKPHKDFETQIVDPKNFDFQVNFGKTGLVISPSDDKPVYGAPFDFMDTTPRKSFRGTGEISSYGRYLLACGFDLAGKTVNDLIAMARESENVPVFVKVGWRDNREKDTPRDVKRVYTSAFKTGVDPMTGKPIYSPRVTLQDGRVVTARAVVEGYINPKDIKS